MGGGAEHLPGAVPADGALDGRIFAIGGADGVSTDRVVEAYDPAFNTWECSTGDAAAGCVDTRLAPMPTPRQYLGTVTSSDGRIFAIGGQISSGGYSNVVEAYNPTTNTWECSANDAAGGCTDSKLVPMPTARYDFGYTLGPDSGIYAIGGHSTTALSTVELYNPTTNSWHCSIGDSATGCTDALIASMPTARQGLGVATTAGQVFAVGGYDNVGDATRVEAYTPGLCGCHYPPAREWGLRHVGPSDRS
ncbi:MAG: Kelch repeat-containing protein [Chloroflexota bacterium]|nr:MAG: hypothetical protein DLM70_01440 [Chloroflexota bacterium]